MLEEFLPFLMQSDIFMDRAVKISVGGLSPTINWRDLAKEEFALPPLEDQRRIAEVLQAAEISKNACADVLLKLQQVAVALGHARSAAHAENYPIVDLENVADVKYA